jgi:hypothetical protein
LELFMGAGSEIGGFFGGAVGAGVKLAGDAASGLVNGVLSMWENIVGPESTLGITQGGRQLVSGVTDTTTSLAGTGLEKGGAMLGHGVDKLASNLGQFPKPITPGDGSPGGELQV